MKAAASQDQSKIPMCKFPTAGKEKRAQPHYEDQIKNHAPAVKNKVRSIPARSKQERLLRVYQKGPKAPRWAGWEEKVCFIKSKSEDSWEKRKRSTGEQKKTSQQTTETHEQHRRGEQTWNTDRAGDQQVSRSKDKDRKWKVNMKWVHEKSKPQNRCSVVCLQTWLEPDVQLLPWLLLAWLQTVQYSEQRTLKGLCSMHITQLNKIKTKVYHIWCLWFDAHTHQLT